MTVVKKAVSVFDEGKVAITTCDENILHNPCANEPVTQTEHPLSACNHKSSLEELSYIRQMYSHKGTSNCYW